MALTPNHWTRAYTGEDAEGAEVEFIDGTSENAAEGVTLSDAGVWIVHGDNETMYPWHQVKAIRGLPAKTRKKSVYETRGLESI